MSEFYSFVSQIIDSWPVVAWCLFFMFWELDTNRKDLAAAEQATKDEA